MTVAPSSVRLVVMAAAIAALFELIVLRLLTRTAVFIPGISERTDVVGAVGELGRLGYFVSLALLTTVLVSLAMLALQDRSQASRALAIALLAFGAFALAARLGWVPRIAADLVTLSAVALLASLVRSRRRAVMVGIAAFSLAFVVAGADAVWRNASSRAAIGGDGGVLLQVSEWLVLGAGLAVIAARRRSSGAAWAMGALLGGVLLAGFIVAPATVRILLLWNVGLPGAMPAAAYGIVALAVGVTVVDAARRGQLATAAGVALLVAGGIGFQSTYQSGLVVAGLAALALRHVLDGEAAEPSDARRQPPSPARRERQLASAPQSPLTKEL